MGFSPLLLILCLLLSLPFSSSSPHNSLTKGSSLSVEKPDEDVLISENGIFTSGFHPVGDNAYCFAIWFTELLHNGYKTIVWKANRDKPVNGRRSKLSLLKTGNLVLTDAGELSVWMTTTNSNSSRKLKLRNDGNLILQTLDGVIHWQSFESPTDTLLPQQPLTKYTRLISSRSQTNYSSGFYQLFFDDDNILRLVYSGPEISSVFWPNPWDNSWQAGRSTNNNSKIAILYPSGQFVSSDSFGFLSSDFGTGPLRRLTMDVDGNLRVYSLDKTNSLCTYAHDSGRRCSCVPGYKMVNHTDWSYGCEPDFSLPCAREKSGFIQLRHVDFYGFDEGYYENYTVEQCEKEFFKFLPMQRVPIQIRQW
ncbi:unnamed protein product [Ilex paraguariensis]|uniref:Bulb-type lectin domain-containing protein n=1 Tax=Ilex paraguariensis TaxID=185542 RepID=A0ABC8TZB7_9AQUA